MMRFGIAGSDELLLHAHWKWKSSRDAREQRVPRAMVLRAVGPCAGELTLQHVQLPDLSNVELLPAMRCTALTLTADLKTEQTLDATSDAVVVRFDDSYCSDLVDELDEILADDRSHELVIHYFRTKSLSIEFPVRLGYRSFSCIDDMPRRRHSPRFQKDRAALHQALRDSDEDVKAGRLVDAATILRELRSR